MTGSAREPGRDRIIVTGGRDVVRSGPDDDEVESSKGRDLIRGGTGDDDVFEHGRSPDDIDAGRGRDVVDDVLVGRRGERVSMGPKEQLREELTVTSRRSVVWDLATGLATVGAVVVEVGGAAKIFPNGRGTWTIRGTSEAELVHVTFSGGTSFYGLGGDDKFLGDYKVPDLFDGGDGVDTYLGAEKRNNTCVSVERDPDLNCVA